MAHIMKAFCCTSAVVSFLIFCNFIFTNMWEFCLNIIYSLVTVISHRSHSVQTGWYNKWTQMGTVDYIVNCVVLPVTCGLNWTVNFISYEAALCELLSTSVSSHLGHYVLWFGVTDVFTLILTDLNGRFTLMRLIIRCLACQSSPTLVMN